MNKYLDEYFVMYLEGLLFKKKKYQEAFKTIAKKSFQTAKSHTVYVIWQYLHVM